MHKENWPFTQKRESDWKEEDSIQNMEVDLFILSLQTIREKMEFTNHLNEIMMTSHWIYVNALLERASIYK